MRLSNVNTQEKQELLVCGRDLLNQPENSLTTQNTIKTVNYIYVMPGPPYSVSGKGLSSHLLTISSTLMNSSYLKPDKSIPRI